MPRLIPFYFINQVTFVFFLIVIALVLLGAAIVVGVYMRPDIRPGAVCACGKIYVYLGNFCPCTRKWYPLGPIPPKL